MKIRNSKTYSRFTIFNLLLFTVYCLLPTEASAWTQTDWESGDSQCLWYATDRYDTGVSVKTDNDPLPPGQDKTAVSMTDLDLVAFWDFNDRGDVGYLGESANADSAYDRTLNGNNGTMTGCMWGDTSNQDSAIWKGGLSFNGISDYVNCGSVVSLGETTVTMWFKSSSQKTNNGIIDFNGGTSLGYFSINHSTLRPILYLSSSCYHYFNASFQNYMDGNWHFLVLYIKGSELGDISKATLSVDTVNIPTSFARDDAPPPDNWSVFYIGKASGYFNGAIDEVRVYSRALTADEIAAQANAFSTEDLGLAAYWKFDDGGDVGFDGISADDSTLSDETSNNNNGTIEGCMWGDTSNDDSALFGGGLSFNGTSDYVDAGDPADGSLDFGTGNFSISCWIKIKQHKDYNRIIAKYGAPASRGYIIYSDSTGGIYVNVGGDVALDNGIALGLVNLDQWYFLTLTKEGDTKKTYLDGNLVTTSNTAVGNTDTTASFLIGTYSSLYFNGAIDEVRIYGRALSADEIADLADSTIVITKSQELGENSPRGVLLSSTFDADSPVIWKTIKWNDPSTEDNPYERGDSRLRKDEKTGLVALWHFDEGEDLKGGTSAQDSTVYDESTNSNTGIVIGCKWGNASEDSAVFQSALSFNGSSDYVQANFAFQPTEFSVEWYLYPLTHTNYNQIMRSVEGTAGYGWNGFCFHTTSTGEVYVGTDVGTRLDISDLPAGTVSLDEWQHFVFTFDNGAGKFYKNGGLLASKTGMTNPIEWGGFIIGTIPDVLPEADTINGAIDEVAIYSYAKTAEEILQDAQGTQIRLRTQTTSSILDGTGADSPVGLWHFDNLANDPLDPQIAYDSSAYPNNGTITGATWYQWGMFGKCLSFDGDDDYVDCGSGDSLGITDAITIEAWVKPNLLGTWGHIAGKYESETDNQAYLLYKTKWGDKVRFLLSPQGDGTDMLYFDSDTSLTLDTWCHVVGVLDNANNTAYIYLNGREDKSAAYNYDIFDSDIPLLVGEDFPGAIDEVAIYNYARTADQIKIDARGWSRWSPYYKNADIDDIVLFADDFNDGDVGIGGYWQEYGKGKWLIDNTNEDTGALKITLSSGDTGIIQANNTNWYNYQVETKVKLVDDGQAGIILNYNHAGNYGYAALLDSAADQIRLYEMGADDVGTHLKTSAYDLNENTRYTLKAQYDGSKIRVYLGDTNYITYPSSGSLDCDYKGYAGLIAANAGAGSIKARFDDFKVYPIDRYVHYEATLTDNVVRDTTPYLYWIRLTYDETTSDDSIWSRIIQDRYTYSALTPRDAHSTGLELNYSDIDGADTVWCYNLENYGKEVAGETPTGAIKVNIATPADTIKGVDLRLGIRKTSAPNYPDEWPENTDDYTWYDWIQYDADLADTTPITSGDTTTWTLTYSTANLATDFATEGGYILQSRAVSNDEGTEPDPTNFQPNDDKYRADTSIIYMIRDITPPGSANTTGGVDGATSLSGYNKDECCANGNKNTLWTLVGVKGVLSHPESTTRTSYRDNTEYVWFNIDSSADDSGIRVKVEDKNPDSTTRESDCSDIDEDDTSIRYRYSVDGGTNWKGLDAEDATSDVATWAKADTNIWTDRYMVIQSDAAKDDDSGTGDGNYRYSIASLDPGEDDYATKGENVLIQFAQKDKAGNWGYSHRAGSNYSATQTSGCHATKGYYINVDLLRPKSDITKGPREANYSSSASFEFKDDSENDSPLLCAFKTLLQQGDDKATPDVDDDYRPWTSYQPWSPTSDEGSATFTDLSTTTDENWYRCFVMAKDEALNECNQADSASYVFQCLPEVPNTIIYSGPAGIVTDDDESYPVTFKYRGEGGSTTPYEFAYKIDGASSWSSWSTTGEHSYTVTSYGNHTFRVKARNNLGPSPANDDPTPASVTFTIADPAAPPAVAPPSDPVKYWREESE